jgi:ABC-2 type transport system permease protein
MRNIMAIAGKELRGYFASPIAYIVLGLFALVFGWFFYVPLAFFNRQSMQMGGGMGGMNISQALIGPVFTKATVVMLTLIHMAILFLFTDPNPDWKPIATAYMGLLLMGGCFISVGMLISSLTKNQVVAATATFVVFLMLWVINWIGTFVGPTAQSILAQLSLTDHFDDFPRGVIDTKHLVYYVSFIALGLFLTAKAVDTERWRG